MVLRFYFTTLIVLLLSTVAYGKDLLISAAMGTKELVKTVGEEFQKETGERVVFNFSSSGKLINQIVAGAPSDVYISASKFWVDYGVKRGALYKETVKPFAETSLVLIAPKNGKVTNLTDAKRIAVGNRLAPVGKYAVETLKNLGVYEKIKDRLVYAPTVRQVTVWVMTGNADLGLVYYSDYLKFKGKVKLVKVLPDNLHKPIMFYVACVKGGDLKECNRFEKFLLKTDSSTYREFGFKKVENGS